LLNFELGCADVTSIFLDRDDRKKKEDTKKLQECNFRLPSHLVSFKCFSFYLNTMLVYSARRGNIFPVHKSK